MRLYDYTINVKSVLFGAENHMIISATNKKEAMKFCKDFKGLKILEKLKGTTENDFKDSESLMSTQKELLTEKLQLNELYIEK